MSNPVRILIVDDDPIFNELLSSFFTDEGFLVFKAFNGDEGYKEFLKTQPDVILSDVIMPVTNGIEMAKKIISSEKKIPIVFMSGYTSNKDLEAIKGSPCWAGIFAKPFEEEVLLQHIHAKIKEFNSKNQSL